MKKLLHKAICASVLAGNEILKVYHSDDFEVEFKNDNSPLTKADKQANDVINRVLFSTEIPILSEEGREISYEERKQWTKLWIVDPLDGTKEFIKRNGEFTVNIALVEDGCPVLGVVYVPDSKVLYYGIIGTGSFKINLGEYNIDSILELGIVKLIEMSDRLPAEVSGDVFKVVGSRSHMSKETEEYIEHLTKKHPNVEVVSAGSAIKLCLVAEGVANEYPRFAPTMEWDTAAGHAIANQAGKKVFAFGTEEELTYNRENNVNGWFLVK